jgi:U3 small nucleolar RNA-associated protein 12
MRAALIPLRRHLRAALCRQKETIGYNLAALQYIRRRNDMERTAQLFEEGVEDVQARLQLIEGKKRKRVSVKT